MAAVKQYDKTSRAHTADSDDFKRKVDEPVTLDQRSAIRLKRRVIASEEAPQRLAQVRVLHVLNQRVIIKNAQPALVLAGQLRQSLQGITAAALVDGSRHAVLAVGKK